jgi:hypothetical protein
MLKRLADFVCGLGVASLAIGLYKGGNNEAVFCGLVLFVICMILGIQEDKA